jgi:hypothetical protein
MSPNFALTHSLQRAIIVLPKKHDKYANENLMKPSFTQITLEILPLPSDGSESSCQSDGPATRDSKSLVFQLTLTLPVTYGNLR